MRKVLFVMTISGKRVTNFMLSSYLAAARMGAEWHLACNFEGCDWQLFESFKDNKSVFYHQVSFQRNPFSVHNRKGYKELFELLKTENFDVVHCNTPTAGFFCRLAGRKLKLKNLIYTVHGFHFMKGGKVWPWLLIFPVEKYLSKFCKVLVTINQEDYMIAKTKNFAAGKILLTHGVGCEQFSLREKENGVKVLKELGLKAEDFAFLSVGYLNKNKNVALLIKAFARAHLDSNSYLLICGEGNKKAALKRLALRLHVEKRVLFLGYRNDARSLTYACNCFVSASQREGLPVSVMDAVAGSVPCAVSNVRGNRDLVLNGVNGYLFDKKSVSEASEAMRRVREDVKTRKLQLQKTEEIISPYLNDACVSEIEGIYEDVMA